MIAYSSGIDRTFLASGKETPKLRSQDWSRATFSRRLGYPLDPFQLTMLISSSVPGSCPPNELQGKPIISNPRGW